MHCYDASTVLNSSDDPVVPFGWEAGGPTADTDVMTNIGVTPSFFKINSSVLQSEFDAHIKPRAETSYLLGPLFRSRLLYVSLLRLIKLCCTK